MQILNCFLLITSLTIWMCAMFVFQFQSVGFASLWNLRQVALNVAHCHPWVLRGIRFGVNKLSELTGTNNYTHQYREKEEDWFKLFICYLQPWRQELWWPNFLYWVYISANFYWNVLYHMYIGGLMVTKTICKKQVGWQFSSWMSEHKRKVLW